jgi:repressor LexA
MTPKQRLALDFITAFVSEHRYSPSMEEIAAAIGKTAKSGAHRIVRALERQGKVRTEYGRSRSVRPVEYSQDVCIVPLRGRIN